MNKTGIIYIIKCKDKNIKDCYIGSTTNLKNRIREHKSSCNNKNCKYYNSKKYKFIRKNGGFDNFYFEILEDEIEFNNRKELNKIERYYIEEFKSLLNINIPSRTEKEYRKMWEKKNKEEIIKKNKEYYQKNREIINEKHRKYNQTEYRKKYKQEHEKKYRERRNELLKEKNKNNIKCICGAESTHQNYSRHCKTKKHLQYIENNN